MLVRKGNKTKVSTNFNEDEFHSNSSDAPKEHDVDDNLILAWQYLRDLFGGVRMHGTARTKKHNDRVGGASQSKHLKFNPALAGDGSFVKNNIKNIEKIAKDIKNKGSIYEDLKYLGVKGLGFYDWGLHVDTATDRANFTVWDNRKKKIKEFESNKEDLSVGKEKKMKEIRKILIGFLLTIALQRVLKMFKIF